MTNGNQLSREDQIQLVEYQVCQQSQNSTTQSYWTLSGIFIGISSILLGGLIFGILSNNLSINTPINITTLRLIITVLGAGIIIILLFLWLWLKRVNYLTDRGYERMREIELDLGMWKSLRVTAIDEWNKQHLKSFENLPDKKIDELWNKIKGKLEEGISEEHKKKLAPVKKELVNWCNACNRHSPQHWYSRPSRTLHYNVLLGILIFLWVFTILSVWLLNIVMN